MNITFESLTKPQREGLWSLASGPSYMTAGHTSPYFVNATAARHLARLGLVRTERSKAGVCCFITEAGHALIRSTWEAEA